MKKNKKSAIAIFAIILALIYISVNALEGVFRVFIKDGANVWFIEKDQLTSFLMTTGAILFICIIGSIQCFKIAIDMLKEKNKFAEPF